MAAPAALSPFSALCGESKLGPLYKGSVWSMSRIRCKYCEQNRVDFTT